MGYNIVQELTSHAVNLIVTEFRKSDDNNKFGIIVKPAMDVDVSISRGA